MRGNKRRRRLPKVIPPRSRVRLARADRNTPVYRKKLGRQICVGYYSRQDGMDCIWLVNEDRKYEHTTDREDLLRYFEIERLTTERDYYGKHKQKLLPLRAKKIRHSQVPR